MDATSGLETGRHRARRRTAWLVAALLLVAGVVALLLTGLAVVYQEAYNASIAHTGEELGAIAETRRGLVEDWRTERLLDAHAASGSPALRENALRLVGRREPGSSVTYAGAWLSVRDDLAILRSKGGYGAALLLDGQGRLAFASDAAAAEIAPETIELVQHVGVTGEPAIGTPWNSHRDGLFHLDVAAPILDADGRVAAVVILRIDRTQVLFDTVFASTDAKIDGHVSVFEKVFAGLLEVSDDPVVAGANVAPPSGVPPRTIVPYDSELARLAGVDEWTDRLPVDAVYGPSANDDGESIYADVRTVGDSPWVVVAERPRDLVEAAATRAGIDSLLRAGLVILAAGLVVAGLLLARQRRLLRRLTRAEHERAVATQRVDDVLAHSRDVVLLLDQAGRILDANAAAVTAYGQSLEQLRERTLGDLRIPDERWSAERDLLRAQVPGGAIWQTVHRRADGSTFPVEVMAHGLRDGDQVRIEIMVHDITTRREAERTMQRQLDELRRWQAGAIGREERILELKAEVNDLLEADGRAPRYGSVEQVARVGRDG